MRHLFIAIYLSCIVSPVAAQQAETSRNLLLEFRNVVGERPLVLNDETYLNAAGEKFNITTFNYFVSNIIIHRKRGEDYVVPQDESYFLIRQDKAESKLLTLQVPRGRYSGVTFTIGVDSLRSTMDLKHRTGALDIAGGMTDGMYWTWNSGYIFLKLEGDCEQAAVDRTGRKKFRYHIGGFGGYKTPSINNIRTVTIMLSRREHIRTKKGYAVKMAIDADALRIFNGNTKVSIAENSAVMFGNYSKLIAENYSGMFRHAGTTLLR